MYRVTSSTGHLFFTSLQSHLRMQGTCCRGSCAAHHSSLLVYKAGQHGLQGRLSQHIGRRQGMRGRIPHLRQAGSCSVLLAFLLIPAGAGRCCSCCCLQRAKCCLIAQHCRGRLCHTCAHAATLPPVLAAGPCSCMHGDTFAVPVGRAAPGASSAAGKPAAGRMVKRRSSVRRSRGLVPGGHLSAALSASGVPSPGNISAAAPDLETDSSRASVTSCVAVTTSCTCVQHSASDLPYKSEPTAQSAGKAACGLTRATSRPALEWDCQPRTASLCRPRRQSSPRPLACQQPRLPHRRHTRKSRSPPAR